MGTDFYGILLYGFPIETLSDDLEEWPWDSEYYGGDWESYLKDKTNMTWFQLTEQMNCSLVATGTYVEGIYFVSVNSAFKQSYYGEKIEISTLAIDPDWDNQIKEFCKLMDITYKQPKWYLTGILSF